MSIYMFQAAYTSESWHFQVQKQENPLERIGPLAESVGGRLLNVYYTFGEYDIVVLVEMPNEESAVAFSLAASAGGSIKAIKTTPLLSVEQGLTAMKKASQTEKGYHAPIPEGLIKEAVHR